MKCIQSDLLVFIEKQKGNSEYSYQFNYELVSKLKEFANKKHLCLLLVHHAKKESGEDVHDDYLGSTGIAAAVDTMMNLKKYKLGFKLHFTGKDVISDDLDLEFDVDKYIWKVIDELYSINTTPERMEILKLFTKESREMRTDEISEKLGKSKSNISNILGKMTKDGLIKNTKFGFYTLTNTFISNSESDVSGESNVNSVSNVS